MNRPRVNLDPIARVLDRLLGHPLVELVDEVAPELVAGVRTMRENLPEVAAGLERRAVEELTRAAAAAADDVGRQFRRGIEKAARDGRARTPRALPGPKKKSKGRARA